MLVFIDESGDPGLKAEKGSSKFFIVSLVVFEDYQEASACDQRIELLKKELGYPPNFEFHFKENSHKIRLAFLEAIRPYNFFYFGIILNKSPEKLWGDGFRNKESLYKYACGLVFENAKPYLEEATIIIDKSGNQVFRNQLAKYLRQKINSAKGPKTINKIKLQYSQKNNLLQLADYIAGTINRSAQNKKFAKDYRKFIAHKEIYVQFWPK
jgi:hypothetical protein